MKQFLFILFIGIAFTTNAQSDKRLKNIDKDLNKILEATHSAGFAVAVVENDKIVYAKGFGYRDVENKIPVDANTLFAIGSCSKAFTSGILGNLRAEDKLSFDDNPRKHIPELKFYNDDMNNNIIIKDLMSHRTGLPRHDISWYLFPTFDRDSLVSRIEYQEPFTGIRQQWHYNNFMFLLQGVIAERITGKSWEDNIREHFFKPLGMTRSNVSILELEKSDNAAIGYAYKNDSTIVSTPYYKIAAMAPAGSINSSVNEMSRWLITWINKGKYNDVQILPETYINEAMSSQAVVSGGLPDEEFSGIYGDNYGYAWSISSHKGHYQVEHGGAIDGFRASTSFFPTDNIGIVVLTNQGGSAATGLVRNTVADRMLNVDRTNWVQIYKDRKAKAKKAENENDDSQSSQVENTKPSHVMQDYTGSYSHPGYGEFKINVERDSLFAQFKLEKLWLKHYHYDVFQPFQVKEERIDTSDANGFSTLLFNFATNDAGDITAMNTQLEGLLPDPIKFKRTPNIIDVDEKQLEAYFGEYELGSMVVKVYAKDGTLFAHVPGQTDYELLATAKHKFNLKILDGFKIEFLEDDAGVIEAVNFIQPNGTFKAIKKK